MPFSKILEDELFFIKQIEKNKENENLLDYLVTFKDKNIEVKIHELNCKIISHLPKIINDCKAVLFMIDSTNRFQISEAFICLLGTLKAKILSDVPVLILLNKCDEAESMTRKEIEFYYHLKDIIKCSSNSEIIKCNDISRLVNVIECSSKEGTGLQHCYTWILEIYVNK